MLRIAVVTRYFPSSAEPWQGRSAYQTLRVLSGQAEVQVFYPNAAFPKFLNPLIRSHHKLDASPDAPDVRAAYYDFPALPLISRPFNGRLAARTVLPHVRAFAPDLIFSFFLYPDGYAALRVGQALGVPVAAMSIGSDINRIGDPITAHRTRTVLRELDFLFTVSDDLRGKALAMGASPHKSRTVINGCDTSVFHSRDRNHARQKLDIRPDAKTVVYVGRIDMRKGLRELVEAASMLRDERDTLRIYLVGDGPDRRLIERAIEARNAGNFVYLRPGCSFDDVPLWMAAADVVTLPSYMEGCPNVVLEALACGRPVVATEVGGIPEIMSDGCGKLVPPRNSAALADALGLVLDKVWDLAAISACGSRSWDTVAAELLEIFEAIVSKRRSANIRP
jgi:teichuronic acid biosynthesis glycosyltransferase TuaC